MKSTIYKLLVISSCVFVMSACSKGSSEKVSGPKAVDLGLSVKWADCNIGATKPEESGAFFQWGGTKNVADTDISISWDNCPYHSGTSKDRGWTKYVSSDKFDAPDDKCVLDPSDDPAHVILGGKWRTPTYDEWKELCSKSIKFYDSLDGFPVLVVQVDEVSLYFPLAGIRDECGLDVECEFGFYWTATADTDDPSCAINFEIAGETLMDESSYRYYGMPIRAVMDK